MLNAEDLTHLPAPARKALYFGLQRIIGSRVCSAWREFLRWERFSADQLDQAVERRLSALLNTAVVDSEYYRNLGVLRQAGESAADFLRRFPILSRPTVRNHFLELVVDSLRPQITSPTSGSKNRYAWLVVKTGGTTGHPTSVVHDSHGRDCGRATRLYAARQCGFPLGTRYFRLWGSEPELYNQQASLQLRIMQGLLGWVPMNAFRAREADLKKHHTTMLAHPEISHLMAYVDAAVNLAQFIKDKGLSKPKLKTIMACAGTVSPEAREILRETFQAEVYDKYGSRDCCDMACECSQHRGLHVCSPNVFLEIVDDSGRECGPGKVGRILVTLLNNASFPMIRYEIGDVGAWMEPDRCPCGSPFPRIQSLQGRQDDMLTTEDGTSLTPAFVRHFVGVSLNRHLIREWQLEQIDAAQFVFRYIPVKYDGLRENLSKLVESFRLSLGKSIVVELREVNEIPPSPTGKVRWIVNTHRKRQEG